MFSCKYFLQDPENLLDFDRNDAAPEDTQISIDDAFFLTISMEIPTEIEYDGISIYRSSSLDQQHTNFEKIFTTNEIGSNSITFEDTGAVYGQWNYYTAVSYYKSVESFSSEAVGIYFQLAAPQCTLEVVGSGIRQVIDDRYDFTTGIEIVRSNENDTLTEIFTNSSGQIFYAFDSLHYDLNAPLDSFTTGAYVYTDIEPNSDYRYEIRSFQDNNNDRRYSSVFSIDSINFERDIPQLDAAALTDTSVRLYGMNIASDYFDSVSVFFFKDSIWELQSTINISEQTYYNDSYIIDLPAGQSYNCRIMVKNIYYYTMSAAQLVVPLTISGFSLVEGGMFAWGCNTGDEECNEDEFPISEQTVESFYISTFEISDNVYDVPGSWPPISGSMPVDSISFIDAENFCSTLGGLYSDYSFYIPTEIEWEYAAKFRYQDQTSTIYPWGNSINLYQANYGFQNDGLVGIGSYAFPSHHGQYDMAGNVMEWVDNCYDETLQQQNNIEECWKVAKGGAYWSDGSGIRTTGRFHLPQDQGFNGVGFRVAMVANN